MADKFQPIEETVDADDYRAFFDSKILRVWHLRGRQRLFRIVGVKRLTSEMFNGTSRQVTMQPKLELATRDGEVIQWPFLLNKVNAKAIAQLYGKRPADWVGKWIQLYPTTTEHKGETVDCIRVRNQVPGADRPRQPTAAPSEPPPSSPALTDHDKATKNDESDVKEDDE